MNLDGHRSGCSWGHWGHCNCGKQLQEDRKEYRKLQEDSGLSRADFKSRVEALVAEKIASGTLDETDPAPIYLNAAREVLERIFMEAEAGI